VVTESHAEPPDADLKSAKICAAEGSGAGAAIVDGETTTK